MSPISTDSAGSWCPDEAVAGFCSNVKVKRSQSPSVAIKFEPNSDEEDKLKVLREEEEVSLDRHTR